MNSSKAIGKYLTAASLAYRWGGLWLRPALCRRKRQEWLIGPVVPVTTRFSASFSLALGIIYYPRGGTGGIHETPS